MSEHKQKDQPQSPTQLLAIGKSQRALLCCGAVPAIDQRPQRLSLLPRRLLFVQNGPERNRSIRFDRSKFGTRHRCDSCRIDRDLGRGAVASIEPVRCGPGPGHR